MPQTLESRVSRGPHTLGLVNQPDSIFAFSRRFLYGSTTAATFLTQFGSRARKTDLSPPGTPFCTFLNYGT